MHQIPLNDCEKTPQAKQNDHDMDNESDEGSSFLKELQFPNSEANKRSKLFTPAPMDDPLKIHFRMQQEAANAKREK